MKFSSQGHFKRKIIPLKKEFVNEESQFGSVLFVLKNTGSFPVSVALPKDTRNVPSSPSVPGKGISP